MGGDKTLCERCRPKVGGKKVIIGLQDTSLNEFVVSGIDVHGQLDEIIANVNKCWLCAWLWLLVQHRCAASLASIDLVDYQKAQVAMRRWLIHTLEKGRLSSPFGDKRVLNQIAIYFAPHGYSESYQYFLHLQQSEQNPPELSDLLDRTNGLNWPRHVPFSARIRPQRADSRLLQRWKERCVSDHMQTCQQTTTDKIQSIRLIDVHARCIIERDGNSSWTALSYSWGGPQVHSLKKNNLEHYRQPGALTDNLLPQVIADAMKVTAILNERYLWVDSLCIIQDDQLDIAKFLSIADAIYEDSVVTIINAATASVYSPEGLPGIRAPCNRRVQEPFQINGFWMTESLDPHQISEESGFLDTCNWSTRGWTFQEGLLARRCLIFTSQQIYWQCQKSTWCEGSFWEQADDKLQIYRHCFGDNFLTSIFEQPMTSDWIEVYQSIMRQYHARTFTTEADRLHGLKGLLRAIERSTGEKFLWATPLSRIEKALTFPQPETAKRRSDKHTFLDAQNQLVSSPFPSWSWLGWADPINMRVLQSSSTVGNLGLRFFSLDENGCSQRIDVDPPPLGPWPDGDVRQRTGYPADATHTWMEMGRQEITSEIIPLDVLTQKDLLPSLLCFWTSTATLKMRKPRRKRYDHLANLELYDEHSQIQAIWDSTEEFQSKGPCKFIVVGTEKLLPSRGGHITLKLLLVENDPQVTGVHKRKHLITAIAEKDWQKLRSRRWEPVFLA